tara:strand:- start:164 stop:1036 length:873 start_codon:yes stop_codon:yes gene_type:complete
MSGDRRGIILAGGTGSRLFPLTKTICKQLLPLYDKPMIYYPLSILMLSGIKEILIIVSPSQEELFKGLLGDGSQWGISIEYALQKKPNGIAEAFLIAEEFIKKRKVALILGDNFFHGSQLSNTLSRINKKNENTIFVYPVKNPNSFGIVEFNDEGNALNIEEKPKNPKSNFAVTGLYFYDETVFDKAKKVTPSDRGELEISSLNQIYLDESNLKVEILNRGSAWLDTGTFDALQEANQYIRILEERQGLKIGCPEEISWRQKWINDKDLEDLARQFPKSGYGHYLLKLIK